MRPSIRALTVIGIAAVLLLFVRGPKRFTAQQWQGYSCVTFYTDTLECPSCCTLAGHSFPDEIEGVTSTSGRQDPYLAVYNCGDPIPGGCSVECSGQYDEAMDDPGCCGQNGAFCVCDDYCVP